MVLNVFVKSVIRLRDRARSYRGLRVRERCARMMGLGVSRSTDDYLCSDAVVEAGGCS